MEGIYIKSSPYFSSSYYCIISSTRSIEMVAGGISMAVASIASWFTPTVLFCTTNLIIATIFIASKTTNNNHHLHDDSLTPISRVSSFLRRTTSLNLSSTTTTTTITTVASVTTTAESHHQPPIQPETATYSSTSRLAQSIYESPPPEPETQPPSQLVRTPSLLDRVRSFRISSFVSTQSETVDTDPSHDSEYYVIGSKSETKSEKKKLSVEMKKSRSEMRIAQKEDDGDDVDARRPATARERRSDDGDDEVDARADDFISRFKQQLKLQRLESLVRYNEMLNRRR